MGDSQRCEVRRKRRDARQLHPLRRQGEHRRVEVPDPSAQGFEVVHVVEWVPPTASSFDGAMRRAAGSGHPAAQEPDPAEREDRGESNASPPTERAGMSTKVTPPSNSSAS